MGKYMGNAPNMELTIITCHLWTYLEKPEDLCVSPYMERTIITWIFIYEDDKVALIPG